MSEVGLSDFQTKGSIAFHLRAEEKNEWRVRSVDEINEADAAPTAFYSGTSGSVDGIFSLSRLTLRDTWVQEQGLRLPRIGLYEPLFYAKIVAYTPVASP